MAEREPQIGYLLKNAQAALHTSMELALRPLGLTVSHYATLHLLRAEQGISASELARRAFVTRQSMNTLLQTLLERGFVERRTSVGRALPTELTAAGERVLGQAEVVVDRVEAKMLRALSAESQHTLAGALTGCITALEGTD